MTLRSLLRTASGGATIATVAAAAAAILTCSMLAAASARAQSPAKSAAAPTKPAPMAARSQAVTGGVVDINHASSAELISVPGIGDVYAAKIIAGRPYANKLQLVQKKILPKATYDKVKDKLIARQ